MSYVHAREWLGAAQAASYWRWTEGYLDRIVELGGDALDRVGSLRLAADADERDELEEELAALREDGFAAEWRAELPGRVGERFPAAIFHPPDASIQPARFVRRLACAAAEAGAEFREHDRVHDLDALEGDTVVVATDGYPSGLLGDLEGLIIPTRGQMIATEPVGERLFDCPHYGRHGFDYWQQSPDGRVLAGGFRDVALDSEFTAEEVTTRTIQDALERFVADVVGRPLAVTHRWAGIFGLVLGFMPVVGWLPGDGRAWVTGGYSGHGNVLGFACGDAVARAILGDVDWVLELFDPARLLEASPFGAPSEP
jgi:gamma-glutamylputrescine oxidase